MNDKIKNAAILLLGLGDQAASEVLKSMTPKEVRGIIDAINSIDNVTDDDIMEAMSDFYNESSLGINISSKEHLKTQLISAIGSGSSAFLNIDNLQEGVWLELIMGEAPENIIELIRDEHPQVVTAIVIIIFNNISSLYGTKFIKAMPKEMQSSVFKRMTQFDHISTYSIDVLSDFFCKELDQEKKYNRYPINGIETVANIISYLDSETEKKIMADITAESKELGDKIQEMMFPFSKLAELDKKSLQLLLSEVKNEDLVLALKGVDDRVKEIFFQNMSQKSADILRDDMTSKGPVKAANVIDAQKNIIRLAKKMDQEEKIMLTSKNNPDIIY